LGVVLYEYLGEEYPEVLGSILGAIKVRSSNFFKCTKNILSNAIAFEGFGLNLHFHGSSDGLARPS
jgi:hypothetical protein